jgi:DNA-directed RNA polymerase subunit H (RpoH/RPB5)
MSQKAFQILNEIWSKYRIEKLLDPISLHHDPNIELEISKNTYYDTRKNNKLTNVIFILSDKQVNKPEINDFKATYTEHQHMVVICKNSSVLSEPYLEIFSTTYDLGFNKLNHFLMPKQIKIITNTNDKLDIVQELHLDSIQKLKLSLCYIFTSDPIARLLGLHSDDIIHYTYSNMVTGNSNGYRYVLFKQQKRKM